MRVQLREGEKSTEGVAYDLNGNPRLSVCNCIWASDPRCTAKEFIRCFPQYEIAPEARATGRPLEVVA